MNSLPDIPQFKQPAAIAISSCGRFSNLGLKLMFSGLLHLLKCKRKRRTYQQVIFQLGKHIKKYNSRGDKNRLEAAAGAVVSVCAFACDNIENFKVVRKMMAFAVELCENNGAFHTAANTYEYVFPQYCIDEITQIYHLYKAGMNYSRVNGFERDAYGKFHSAYNDCIRYLKENFNNLDIKSFLRILDIAEKCARKIGEIRAISTLYSYAIALIQTKSAFRDDFWLQLFLRKKYAVLSRHVDDNWIVSDNYINAARSAVVLFYQQLCQGCPAKFKKYLKDSIRLYSISFKLRLLEVKNALNPLAAGFNMLEAERILLAMQTIKGMADKQNIYIDLSKFERMFSKACKRLPKKTQ